MKYSIKKGCHYSNFFPKFLRVNDILVFNDRFRFTDSCKYEIAEQSCVNKLFGFCFGFGVHKNSVRFGWTYSNEMNCIFIWSYFYKNSKLHKEKIFSCDIGDEHSYQIELHRISSALGNYTFRLLIDGNEVYGFQEIQSNKGFLTTLGPYFGGNTRAPHKIFIENINT